MTQFRIPAAVSALAALLAAAPALADTFTLNPSAVGLDGTKVTADTLVLSDYAQISLTPTGPTTATFLDAGYLPVIGFRLNGQAVLPSGYLATDGSGWGAYIRYSGTGTQIVSPQGVPVSATYQTLTYEIVGYNGLATFGFAPDGSATAGGAVSNVTTLDSGSLIGGNLDFLPGQPGPTINGQAQASLTEVKPQFIESNPGSLDVSFIHPAGEYVFTSPLTLQIAGGTSSSATILASGSGAGSATASDGVPLPEPASAVLLGIGLAGVVLLQGRGGQCHRCGRIESRQHDCTKFAAG
jgi:hypothetical protein